MSAYEPVTLDAGQPATVAEVGPMVTGADVEAAVIATLRDWLPSYIAEAERKHGMQAGLTPAPRGWAITGRNLDKFSEDQLPCIVIMAGGIVPRPLKEGPPGVLTAIWGVDVGTVFGAAYNRSSRQHAQLYARAIHLCLQQRPLEGLRAVAVDWRGEAYDEMDFPDSRAYSVSVCSLNIEVREVAWAAGGPPPYVAPPTDPTQPFDPWVTVTETDTQVENYPTDSPLPSS
jgi:hypothetical protein